MSRIERAYKSVGRKGLVAVGALERIWLRARDLNLQFT
jgi:hypothetical protein